MRSSSNSRRLNVLLAGGGVVLALPVLLPLLFLISPLLVFAGIVWLVRGSNASVNVHDLHDSASSTVRQVQEQVCCTLQQELGQPRTATFAVLACDSCQVLLYRP